MSSGSEGDDTLSPDNPNVLGVNVYDNITVHVHLAPVSVQETLTSILNQLEKFNMDLVQALNNIKAQADKAKAEILARLAALEAALATASVVDPAVLEALAAAQASVQGLDDVVPDAAPGEVVAP